MFARKLKLSYNYFTDSGSTRLWYTATQFNTLYDPVGNVTWIAFEGYTNNARAIYVMLYDHATRVWSEPYFVDYIPMVNDDHGVPAIAMDDNRRVHIWYGDHQGAGGMQLVAYTTNPADPTSWTLIPTFSTVYTYAHPVNIPGQNLQYVLIRRTTSSDKTATQQPLVRRKVTINATTGVPTIGSELLIVNPGTDTRVYQGNAFHYNGEVYQAFTLSDYNDTYRANAYVVVIDPLTDTIRNYANTFSVAAASLPIDLVTLNANFRVYTNTNQTGNIPGFWLNQSTGKPHLTVQDGAAAPYVISYITHDGTNWTTAEDTGLRTSNRYGASGVRLDGSGNVEAMSVRNADNTSAGGNIYFAERVSGVWSVPDKIADDATYDLHNVVPVLTTRDDFKWIWFEITPTSDMIYAGYQRAYAWGDSGYVTRNNYPKTLTLSHEAITTGYKSGDVVAMLDSPYPRATYSISSDASGLLAIGDRYKGATYDSHDNAIVLTGAPSAGSYPVTVTVTPRDLPAYNQNFTLTVGAQSAVEAASPILHCEFDDVRRTFTILGDRVDAFYDRSANNRLLISNGNRPYFQRPGLDVEINGKDVVHFGYGSGIDASGLRINGTITGLPTAATIFVVAAIYPGQANFFPINDLSSANFPLYASSGSVDTILSANSGTPTYRINGTAFAGTTRGDLYAAIGTDTPRLITIENVNISAWTGFTFGRLGTGGAHCRYKAAHASVIGIAVDTTTRNAIEAQLAATYGITLP